MRAKWILVCASVMLVLAALPTTADTIHLLNGATIDGEVISESADVITLRVGERTVVYRKSEIDRREENEKTGHFDRAAALARYQERDKELTEQTGLTAEQRRTVRELILGLKSEERGVRNDIHQRLVAMQQQADLYPYLELSMKEMSHILSPWVLEAMFVVAPARVLPVLPVYAAHSYNGTRKMALRLFAEAGIGSSWEFVARGLVDHYREVQIEAAKSLAALGAKGATPALLDLAALPDVYVSGASLESLQALWSGSFGESGPPQNLEEWNAFWGARVSSVPRTVRLASLEPLIEPESEYQNE